MLEFFRMAREERKPYFKEMSLVDLMRYGADEAGWYQEYNPNCQNRTKYQVGYKKPFNSAIVAEIVCRSEAMVMNFLKKRDIDPTVIDSYVGWGFFNFIKTYKPDSLDTDEKIKQAIYRSIQNKVDQSNRKERFKYMPGYEGTSGGRVQERASKKGQAPKVRYVNTCKTISLSLPIGGSGDDEVKELGDYIPDTSRNPEQEMMDQVETQELCIRFTNNDFSKILLEILIDCGTSGKVSVNDLKQSALHNQEFVDLMEEELGFTYNPNKGLTKAQDEALHIKIKTFYRKLRKRLKIEFQID